MGLCTKRSFDCRAFTLPVSDVKRRGSCGAKSSRQLSEQGMSHQHQGYRDRRHVVAARRAELRFCKAIRNRSTPTPALEEYFMKYKPTKGLVCRLWGKTRPQLSDKTCKRGQALGSSWARQTNKPQLHLNGYPVWSLQLPYRIPKPKAFSFMFVTPHVMFQPHKTAEKTLTNWM